MDVLAPQDTQVEKLIEQLVWLATLPNDWSVDKTKEGIELIIMPPARLNFMVKEPVPLKVKAPTLFEVICGFRLWLAERRAVKDKFMN